MYGRQYYYLYIFKNGKLINWMLDDIVVDNLLRQILALFDREKEYEQQPLFDLKITGLWKV